jgi:hypothetical protein
MKTYPIERIFADLGTGLCLILTLFVWWQVAGRQEMFPFPALYFIEVMAVSVLTAAAMWAFAASRRGLFAWAAAGLFLGFALLGALSVGFFYLPVALLFALAGLAADIRTKQNILPHLGVFLVAGVIQVVVMLAVVQFFL